MSKQTILVIIFIIILVAIAYVWLNYQSATPEKAATEGDKEALDLRFSELRRLKDIKFDTSIFQDKFFQNLKPPPSAIQEEAKIGRENPFVPF